MHRLVLPALGLISCSAGSTDTDATGLPTDARTGDTATAGPAPQGVGTYALFSSHVSLELPDGSPRSFHLHAPLAAFRSNLPFVADFDGDGHDSVGVLRADGAVLAHGHNASGALPEVFRVAARQLPVAGDFDGNGADGFGTHDYGTGAVSLWDTTPPEGPADHTLSVPPTWFVVAADLDGDGTDGLIAYDAATGDTLRYDPLDASGVPVDTDQIGWPVAGDLDDDGVDELGVYRLDRSLAWLDATGAVTSSRTLGTETLFQWPLVGRWSTSGELDEPTGFAWPTTSPAGAGFDASLLEQGFTAAEALPLVNSLLVLHDGTLVREAYWRGYDASRVVNIKSVSKSLLSALFGVAVADGDLAVDDPLSDYLPGAFGDDPRADITVGQLLTMTSGLAWDEAGSSIPSMVATEDWVGFVTGQPLTGTPGATFNYSTGNTHVGAAVLEAATGLPMREYARRHVLAPLGISFTRWDVDPQGADMGGAEVWMRPRDLLRLGQLYLGRGSVDGTRVLDASWVDATFTQAVPGYGRWWWYWSLDGQDAWVAQGYGGQVIVVVPSRELVVVGTAEWSVDGGTSLARLSDWYRILDQYVVPAAPD